MTKKKQREIFNEMWSAAIADVDNTCDCPMCFSVEEEALYRLKVSANIVSLLRRAKKEQRP